RTIGASVLIVAALIAFLAYFPYFWTHGATPGQRLLGLRVVDAESMEKISGGAAVVRLVGLWLSFLIVYLGVLWVLIDGRKQGWHDKLAGTLVLRKG
ncbi:MAG: RDD family protein, partial [Candidatus Limnocylindrales bacterium]